MITEQELKQIVCEKFLDGDVDFPLDADTKLLDEGICDSLSLVQLASEMERRSPGLKIRDQEVTHENFGSIRAMLQFLSNKRG